MQVIINSESAAAVIDSFGAELSSLRDSGGTEYLWQADPAVWKRHAPVLFPFICSTPSKRYTYGGKEYQMSNHGFARDSKFELVRSEDSEAEFLLRSSEETKKLYPFDFELLIRYSLSGSRLTVAYTVKNTGNEEMYFFIGGHPAFIAEPFEDCYVEYEKPETVTRGSEVIADNCRKVEMSHDLFANDVFMKDKPSSGWVALVNKSAGRYVKLSYDPKGCIAVWSSWFEDKAVTERAKFVCLEPWSSVPVYCDNTEELTEMSHAIKLPPEKFYVFEYSIEIG